MRPTHGIEEKREPGDEREKAKIADGALAREGEGLTYCEEKRAQRHERPPRRAVTARSLSSAKKSSSAIASTVVAALALPWFVLLAPALVTGALATGGLALARRGSTPASGMAVEQRILQLAVECGGRLTVTSVAAALSMSLAESDRALTELARGGHVEIGNDPASGGFGVHKFYLGQPVQGVFFFLFCWTLIPAFSALREGLSIAFMTRSTFDIKYNSRLT